MLCDLCDVREDGDPTPSPLDLLFSQVETGMRPVVRRRENSSAAGGRTARRREGVSWEPSRLARRGDGLRPASWVGPDGEPRRGMRPQDDLSLRLWHQFRHGAGKTLKSFVISSHARLAQLQGEETLRILGGWCGGRDDLRLETLGQEADAAGRPLPPRVVFVISSDFKDDLNSLLSILMTPQAALAWKIDAILAMTSALRAEGSQGLTQEERSVISACVERAYRAAGGAAPTLGDFVSTLREVGEGDGREEALRLALVFGRYVSGPFSFLNHQSNVDFGRSRVTSFNTRDVPSDMGARRGDPERRRAGPARARKSETGREPGSTRATRKGRGMKRRNTPAQGGRGGALGAIGRVALSVLLVASQWAGMIGAAAPTTAWAAQAEPDTQHFHNDHSGDVGPFDAASFGAYESTDGGTAAYCMALAQAAGAADREAERHVAEARARRAR